MSNITLNPGTGGSTVATDIHGGDHYQLVKATGNRQSFWPGYSGVNSTLPEPVNVDDGGALVTRGAVLTDEGTFRVNFSNTAYAVDIGSVTISGNVVTGTGFLAADLHYKDYFKLSADAETAWVQIDTIDSDTQLTLVSSYVGGSSGTGQRSLIFPMIGSGGSLSVASGALTIASGTTATSVTGVKRFTDYAPLVFRARLSISQRIANQEIHIGLEEDAATTRWFARFLADGTTNTTIKCETGRNPSGTPSASETETTTVTLPFGLTTATLQDYRVELLTESVRFYIGGIRVAEHTRVIPAQHDPMTSHVEVRNGTTPASGTSVVVDYITGKNHNKLEVGVMSDAEKIVAVQEPADMRTYSVAGVITINTDLMVIDCSQLRHLSVHCTSMGTTGVVTPAWSNDGTNWVTATMMSEAGATSTTFNAAGLRTTNVRARYFRLRLTTATTAGTTTIVVAGFQQDLTPPITTQPISGTVTANIGTGALAAGTNAIGDVGVQYRASATGAATLTNINCPATPAAQQIKGTAGRLIGLNLFNTSASTRWVKLFNLASASVTPGTTSATTEIGIPAGGRLELQAEGGASFGTGITIMITGGAGLTNNTAVTLADVTGFSLHA